ncbi:MAG: hypothetical protein L0215_21555 [Gemmataceae bacterium]|nr:hypothetical protein [Gemmataceae bacterium]
MALEDVLRGGKLEPVTDPRTFRFGDVFEEPDELPESFDFDLEFPELAGISQQMYLNNQLSCCVISGRAHQTLRFEFSEQGKIINITDNEIKKQYFNETGGADNGLVLLDSLKSWRNDGWIAGRRKYTIDMFAEIDRSKRRQIKSSIFLQVGIGIGLALPVTARNEFVQGIPWSDTAGRAGGGGGHYVFVTGYTPKGLTCVTWGRKQHMTWGFFDKYCVEAFALVDDLNRFEEEDAGVDVTTARELLNEIDEG